MAWEGGEHGIEGGGCVCVFVLRLLLFPYRGGRTRALSSAYKSDQVDFTDWMSFLTSNLMEEIGPNT